MLASYVSLLPLLILASAIAEDVPEKTKRNTQGNIGQQTKFHPLHQNGNLKPYYQASNQELSPTGHIQTYQAVPGRSYTNLENSEHTNYKTVPAVAKSSKLVTQNHPFPYTNDQLALNPKRPNNPASFERFEYQAPLKSDTSGYQAAYPQVSPTYQALKLYSPRFHQGSPEYQATTIQGQRTTQDPRVQANGPFLSPHSSFQGRVVPIQAVQGQAQFPRFKGATVQVQQPTGTLRQATAYQALQAQPQLHFERLNGPPVASTLKPFRTAQGFLNDVEIINKEKPQQPRPNDEDDSGKEADDGYKGVDFERASKANQFEKPSTESHFKPSRSFPFQQYDEVFGKYSRPGQSRQTEKPHQEQKDYSPGQDKEEDEDSGEVSSRVRDDSPGESSYESYESGEETSQTRKETEGPSNDDYTFKSEPYSQYKDLEKEFEDSYRRDPPKQKYVHVKEVPEVSYSADREEKESDEPRGQGTRVSYEVENSSKLHERANQDEPYGYRGEKKKSSYGF